MKGRDAGILFWIRAALFYARHGRGHMKAGVTAEEPVGVVSEWLFHTWMCDGAAELHVTPESRGGDSLILRQPVDSRCEDDWLVMPVLLSPTSGCPVGVCACVHVRGRSDPASKSSDVEHGRRSNQLPAWRVVSLSVEVPFMALLFFFSSRFLCAFKPPIMLYFFFFC